MTPVRTSRRSDQGFALLIVLWSLVLLALMGSQFAATGRTEATLATNMRGAAEAQAAADGAIHEGLFHLLDSSSRHWPADGTMHAIRVPGVTIELRMRSEAGKVDVNSATPDLLTALLHAAGADERTAAAVGVAISDWRFPDAQDHAMQAKAPQYRAAGRNYGPPNAPFETVGELGLVLGMTPQLLMRLSPHITIEHDGEPDPELADPLVLQAIGESTGLSSQMASGPRDDSVVAITAVAAGNDGSRFVRRAIARVGGHDADRPYRILTWNNDEE